MSSSVENAGGRPQDSAMVVHVSSTATGAQLTYRAVIEPAAVGFSLYFPDLPGCTSAGDDVAAALRNAQDALDGHLELMVEHGDEIPLPHHGNEQGLD